MATMVTARTTSVTMIGVVLVTGVISAEKTMTATHGLVDVINAWMDCQVMTVAATATVKTANVTRISVAQAILVTSANDDCNNKRCVRNLCITDAPSTPSGPSDDGMVRTTLSCTNFTSTSPRLNILTKYFLNP